MNDRPSALARGGALVLLAAAALLAALPVANPDLFWHLSAGRWMAEHGALPASDWLSHTRAGAPWTDFEWLPQLAYHAAWSAAGGWGLWGLKLAWLVAFAGALWSLLGAYAVGPAGRAGALLCWLLASPSANDLRPENFSLFAFVLLLGGFERARLAGRREATRAELAVTALLFAAWANVHAGYVYGAGLLVLYGSAAAARARSPRPLAPAAVAAAALLANPWGWRVWLVPWEHLAVIGDLQKNIIEWQEASVLNPWQTPFWLLLAGSLGALVFVRRRSGELSLEHALLWGALAFSASRHVRTAPYFSAAALAVAAASAPLLSAPARARWAAALGASALLFAGARYHGAVARGLGGLDPLYVPVGAVDYIESELPAFRGKRLFHHWHWGGYIGWRLKGQVPVFADGRYLFHDLLEGMLSATESPERYGRFLDEHRVEAVVIQRAKAFIPMRADLKGGGHRVLLRPFYIHFLPRERWALVHFDRTATVFVRRDAFPAAWVKAREFRWFRPGDLEAVSLAVSEGDASFADVAAEVNRWASAAPEDEAAGARFWLAALAREP